MKKYLHKRMLHKIKLLLKKKIFKQYDLIETNLMLNSKILIELLSKKDEFIKKDIRLAEFKVFSQFGDDGIIQFLIRNIDIKHKNFIEFGVENYLEANTRFLLCNNKWSGLVIDGSQKNIDEIKSDNIFVLNDLQVECAFVTKENIEGIIKEYFPNGDVGILHIDIDGNDYWIWKEIQCIDPEIVIMEYNSVFGYKFAWTIPYDPSFYRINKHYSALYFGASLRALIDLGIEKGYSFIGCNSAGNNAYFVKSDKLNGIEVKNNIDGYVESHFKESRSPSMDMTYLRKGERLALLKGLPIYNTITNSIEQIQ